ncbi:MAG: rhodanese-like domain-containing protein [Legionellaceae bacterium]|nr:rhodanese-like domain-containing protein [Legionellaceae bacterium]
MNRTTDIPTIDVHTLHQLRQKNPNLHLIDVREPKEWQAMRIPGAVLIPKDTICQGIEALNISQETPIYLHCHSGMRSLYAAQCLLAAGYTNITSVDGGIKDWMQSGYDVEEG